MGEKRNPWLDPRAYIISMPARMMRAMHQAAHAQMMAEYDAYVAKLAANPLISKGGEK